MISPDEIVNKLKWLQELFRTFNQIMEVKEEDYALSVSELINIVVDVDEEISITKQFHSLDHVSIAREISLYCYYILKRKPIIVTEEKEEYVRQINEKFCSFILLSITENIRIWDEEYIRFLISMLYRGELSKDALYLLAITMHQVDKLGGRENGG